MLDPQRLHWDNSLRELKVREIKKTHLYTNIYKMNDGSWIWVEPWDLNITVATVKCNIKTISAFWRQSQDGGERTYLVTEMLEWAIISPCPIHNRAMIFISINNNPAVKRNVTEIYNVIPCLSKNQKPFDSPHLASARLTSLLTTCGTFFSLSSTSG